MKMHILVLHTMTRLRCSCLCRRHLLQWCRKKEKTTGTVLGWSACVDVGFSYYSYFNELLTLIDGIFGYLKVSHWLTFWPRIILVCFGLLNELYGCWSTLKSSFISRDITISEPYRRGMYRLALSHMLYCGVEMLSDLALTDRPTLSFIQWRGYPSPLLQRILSILQRAGSLGQVNFDWLMICYFKTQELIWRNNFSITWRLVL